MRTKVLCAAALAAGALTSMAQVYSANVVGYVNVTITGGGNFTMIANPLDATMGGTVAGANNIANLFPNAGSGDSIYRWDVSSFDFSPTIPTYNSFTKTWSSPFDLNPGEGVFYNNNNNDMTVTFVGQVFQGSKAQTLVGNGSFNAIGALAPVGGSFTNAIAGTTPGSGDSIYIWNVSAFDFASTIPTYNSFTKTWSADATIAPGIGFFYNNNNADMPWTYNFTVQ